MVDSQTVQPKGLSVLVVEDEALIRMLLEDMLDDLGHKVGGTASQVKEAEALARQGKFDLAILDVHLNGSDVYTIAGILAERGIPFVFATGYGERGIPAQFRDRPTVQKPFQSGDLKAVLTRALEVK